MKISAVLALIGAFLVVPRAPAETLSFVDLKPNEEIAIVYRSRGCFHLRETMYRAQNGKRFRLAITENPTAQKEGKAQEGDRELMGIATLTSDDRFGLDCYLLFLRQRYKGGSTTTDDLVVGYYRDGAKIGEERFVDNTSAVHGELQPDGRIIQSGNYGGSFPKNVFEAIVPPWMIAMRLKEMNKVQQAAAQIGRE